MNNIVWLNQTSGSMKSLPGADKWIVGNYLNMFSLFRINYDTKNWLMLTEQLIFNHKVSFSLDKINIVRFFFMEFSFEIQEL